MCVLQGETGVAIATLQRLGDDIEVSLKQLLYGTINRTFRVEIAAEMEKYGYLGPFDQRMMDIILHIEVLDTLVASILSLLKFKSYPFYPFGTKVCSFLHFFKNGGMD